VRSLALLFAADNHPVLTPRVVRHLTDVFHADGAQRLGWVRHWFREGLLQGESRLAGDPATGAFCHGDAPSLADLCLVSHAVVARDFSVETGDLPTVSRIVDACLAIDAFSRAQPRLQPGAPPSA
jgi:maleylacetoacetate isomerase